MLEYLSDREYRLWIKRKQLIYFLKTNRLAREDFEKEEIEDYIEFMTTKRLEELYKTWKEQIKKEIWINCYPNYYHISEFNKKLKAGLERINALKDSQDEWDIKFVASVNNFFKDIGKSKLSELTVEEKKTFHGIFLSVTY